MHHGLGGNKGDIQRNRNMRWIRGHTDQKDNSNQELRRGDTDSATYGMPCLPSQLASRRTSHPRIQFLVKATNDNRNVK